MALVSTDAIWIACAVHADTWAIDTHPNYAYRAIRPRRKIVRRLTANSGLQNRFIPPEIREKDIPRDLPLPLRNGNFRRSGSAGKASHHLVALVNLDQSLCSQKHQMPLGFWSRGWRWRRHRCGLRHALRCRSLDWLGQIKRRSDCLWGCFRLRGRARRRRLFFSQLAFGPLFLQQLHIGH